MINTSTQLLVKRCGHIFDHNAAELARNIEVNVARMEQLIEHLLHFSDVVHKTPDFGSDPADAERCLDHARSVYQEHLDEANASLEVGNLPMLAADETQLSLVFENLFSNSLKYAHPQRNLRIRVWAEQEGQWWTIFFADNGIGFKREFADRIFGLFKRLHGSETGLGLAFCRRIIERYSGKIWADGTPQGGATFAFTLKAYDQLRAGGGQSR